MKVFLIYGGKSEEHDISVLSAHSIVNNIYFDYYEVQLVYITREGRWLKGRLLRAKEDLPTAEEMKLVEDDASVSDMAKVGRPMRIDELQDDNVIAFPVLHGPNGEDGSIQGLFETLNIPYVGCGVLASSVGMDKSIAKLIFSQYGLPQVPYEKVWLREWQADPEAVMDRCQEKLGDAVFVKPSNLGSSVGISEAKDRESLQLAIDEAFRFDRTLVIEQAIDAKEIEVGILGNDDVHPSVPGELVKERKFYDYKSKYLDNTVEMQIPANLPQEISKQIRQYAIEAFTAIDGSGLARVDFFVTDDNDIYVNEINSFPGFTQFSMYPSLWEATGLSYSDIIEELIQLGWQRFEERKLFFTASRENNAGK